MALLFFHLASSTVLRFGSENDEERWLRRGGGVLLAPLISDCRDIFERSRPCLLSVSQQVVVPVDLALDRIVEVFDRLGSLTKCGRMSTGS